MANPYDSIRDEHRNIDRVLGCLAELLEGMQGPRGKPKFELLTSIIYYLRVFPYRFHHPKEDQHLFRLLRRRQPSLAPTLDALEREHKEGDRMLEELGGAVDACAESWPQGCEQLFALAATYLEHERKHMQREETEVLPAARRHLLPEDWDDIAHAFSGHADPLFGDRLETGFRALYRHIVDSTSANQRKPGGSSTGAGKPGGQGDDRR